MKLVYLWYFCISWSWAICCLTQMFLERYNVPSIYYKFLFSTVQCEASYPAPIVWYAWWKWMEDGNCYFVTIAIAEE